MYYSELPANVKGIYKIVFPNGKIYVGRSENIKRRIWEHYNKKNDTPCQRALHKYFSSYLDIKVEILQQSDDSKKLYDLEKEWIKKLDATNREVGYNITSGGDGGGAGIYNAASKFSKEDLKNIVELLRQGRTNVYISEIYSVHPDTIGKINNGRTYYQPSFKYPIRKGKGKKSYWEAHNSFSKEQILDVVYLLSSSEKTRKQISEITKVSVNVITNINMGRHPSCKEINLSFPIRNSRKVTPLTDVEIQNIKQLLLNKNLSMEEIAKKHSCSSDLISDINNGRRYTRKEETYPIRNFYPNRK